MRSHNFHRIPDELKAIPRWVNWSYGKRGDKITKIPKQPGSPRRNASSTDPDNWGSFEQAMATFESNDHINGIGFVFTADDDICGVDIDHARDPETGELSAEAERTVDTLDSYTEASPSGTGTHTILFAKLPGSGRKKGGFECYEHGRFFTMTGDHIEGTPGTVEHRQEQLSSWHASIFGAKATAPRQPAQSTDTPRIVADDEDVLASLRRSRKSKRKFEMLFDEGDWEHAGDFGSQSEADLALCSLIAPKTDNPEQVDRLFRRSALMRPKWDEQHGELTYGEMTIAKALESARSRPRKPPKRDIMVKAADPIELFHTPQGDAFAFVETGGHRKVLRLSSSSFRDWLLYEYYTATGEAPGAQALAEATQTLIAKAQIEGPEREVYTRVAEHDGRIYLDLGDDTYRVVEISRNGWRLTTECPVPFYRTANTKALPLPAAGGDIEELRQFVNVASSADFVLLVSWLIGAMHPSGPYPLLVLQGEQGSAKSTTSRVIRNLVDPGVPTYRGVPKSEWDLMVAANYSHVLAFDNLSGLTASLSDVFCQLATGAGFGSRKLYTDDEEVVMSVKRPILVNGISDLAKREDLASRAIVLRLPHIDSSKRKRERDLDAAFAAARPRIFGALLDGLSSALCHVEAVELDSHPRMADFAAWMVAAEPALGFLPGSFMAAYEANRTEVIHTALEGDAVAAGVLAIVYPTGTFTGTMNELLHELNETVNKDYRVGNNWWPANPRALSDRITRLGAFFHSVGVSVERSRESGGSRRNLVIITHDRSVDQVHIDRCMLDEHHQLFRKSGKAQPPRPTLLPDDDCPF